MSKNQSSDYRRAVPPLRAESDFERVFDGYHDASLPGDTLTYLWIHHSLEPMRQRSRPPTDDDVRLLLNGYLRGWGEMWILGPETDEPRDDVFHNPLGRVLDDQWAAIGKLQKVKGCQEEVPATLSGLFEEIAASFKSRGPPVKMNRSPVATAKLLHILLPELCVIWDNVYVINRGLRTTQGKVQWFDADGGGYLAYLTEKFNQFRRLAERLELSTSEFSERVVARHAELIESTFPGLAIDSREPLTKILDEANYLENERISGR